MNTKTFAALLLAGTMMTTAGLTMAATQDEINKGASTVTDVKKLDADMMAVINAHATLNPKPIETLTPAEARKQPTLTDAVKVVLTQKGKPTFDAMGVTTQDTMVAGGAGQIPARIYFPEDAAKKKADGKMLPVVVYFHGGGWVIATNDVYDSSPRAMAKMTDAIVVSVEYRKAPEAKFPAAHDDAFAAYKWVVANAASFGGDVKRVVVMGESAGGNLAINTAIAARDAGVQLPTAEVLVYPVAGTNMNTPSYQDSANAKPLNKAMMGWFVKNATNGATDLQDPRLDINGKANLKGLPPTTLIMAESDPLRSDGQMLADKLKAADVKVESKTYEGVTHEFFGMGAVVGDAKDAEKYAADALEDSFK